MGVQGSNPTGAGTLTVGRCCSAPCVGRGGRKGLGLGTAAVSDTLLSQPCSAGSAGGQPGTGSCHSTGTVINDSVQSQTP